MAALRGRFAWVASLRADCLALWASQRIFLTSRRHPCGRPAAKQSAFFLLRPPPLLKRSVPRGWRTRSGEKQHALDEPDRPAQPFDCMGERADCPTWAACLPPALAHEQVRPLLTWAGARQRVARAPPIAQSQRACPPPPKPLSRHCHFPLRAPPNSGHSLGLVHVLLLTCHSPVASLSILWLPSLFRPFAHVSH